jgi:isopenicillin N synthase-like dioxygenase
MPSTAELKQTDPVVGRVADQALCIGAEELFTRNRADVAAEVRTACRSTGFFYVDLTARQRETIETTLFQMERFFSLEDHDRRKQDVKQETRDFGWVPRYSEPAYQPGTISRLEAFDFGLENICAEQGWPRLPDFRASMSRAWQEYTALGDGILEILAGAATLDRRFFIERCDSRALNTMRLLNYSADAGDSAENEVGIAAHTDFEVITLLYQTAPGLELLDTHGRWLDAPVREGRLVVLLGDMIERWTNGTFKATGHRVQTTGTNRFSVVLFVAANDDIEVAPLPQFVSATSPARYVPITQAQHIDNEIKRAQENRR